VRSLQELLGSNSTFASVLDARRGKHSSDAEAALTEMQITLAFETLKEVCKIFDDTQPKFDALGMSSVLPLGIAMLFLDIAISSVGEDYASTIKKTNSNDKALFDRGREVLQGMITHAMAKEDLGPVVNILGKASMIALHDSLHEKGECPSQAEEKECPFDHR
jgi:hypothetical protein